MPAPLQPLQLLPCGPVAAGTTRSLVPVSPEGAWAVDVAGIVSVNAATKAATTVAVTVNAKANPSSVGATSIDVVLWIGHLLLVSEIAGVITVTAVQSITTWVGGRLCCCAVVTITAMPSATATQSITTGWIGGHLHVCAAFAVTTPSTAIYMHSITAAGPHHVGPSIGTAGDADDCEPPGLAGQPGGAAVPGRRPPLTLTNLLTTVRLTHARNAVWVAEHLYDQ